MAAGLALVALAATTDATASEYRLVPQDKVRVRVYEWRAARDEIFEWPAMNDEFTVSASGNLALPLTGEIPAAGMATAELARTIGARLKAVMGLLDPPDTSVEIVQFRPIYLAGQVERPGEYPFRPGLSVLQAVSVAGGLRRASELGPLRAERELISGSAEIVQLSAESNNLLARRARLEAELARAAQIDFPAELRARRTVSSIALLLEQEQLIFGARRDALQTQVEAFENLKAFLQKEVISLEAQLELQDRQLRLIKKELQSVTSLVDKGLAVAPRQLALERSVADSEADRLRLGTSLLKAKQDISRTDISILDLRSKRATEVTAELRLTQAKLEELGRKADTAEKLLYETRLNAAQSILERNGDVASQPTYTIVRRSTGQVVSTTASEAELVEPGDTIKVDLVVPETQGRSLTSFGTSLN